MNCVFLQKAVLIVIATLTMFSLWASAFPNAGLRDSHADIDVLRQGLPKRTPLSSTQSDKKSVGLRLTKSSTVDPILEMTPPIEIASSLSEFETSSAQSSSRDELSQTDPKSQQSPSSEPTPTPSPKPRFIGRLFHKSSKGYMAALMKREQKFLDASKTIQEFTQYVDNALVQFLRNNSERPPKQPLNPCNHDGSGFIKSMWYWFEQRNLPLLEENCITEFADTLAFENETENENHSFSRKSLLDAFKTREAALAENRFRIADVLLGNWTEPDVVRAYQFESASEHCSIYQEGGVKVDNKWYLFTSITNKPMEEFLPLFERQMLTEMLHVTDDRSLIPLRFSARSRPNETNPDQTHHWVNDTTTTLFSDQGVTPLGRFQDIYPEEIPSLVSAMEKSDLWIQQAQDAITLSSLSILILPVFLNLIPIAILAPVQTSVLILYTIMSDVVTVIPLGIKGWELINIGKLRNIASTIRITGFRNGTISERAAMQMWVTECKTNNNVHTLGIVFLSVAIVSLIVGVSLEFVAKAYMTKRALKRRLFQLEHEPLITDPADFDADIDATVGAVHPASRNESKSL